MHLREDRRHIQDQDVRRLRELTHIKLNLEMAATSEMVAIACDIRPEMAMLVPEAATQKHLEILSEIAEMLSDAALRQKLAASSDAADLHALIANWRSALPA